MGLISRVSSRTYRCYFRRGSGLADMVNERLDYYGDLGVDRKCTSSELKKAYHKACLKYHPDKNLDDKNSEAKFKAVNVAYRVLSDPHLRAAYDNGTYEPKFPGQYKTKESSPEEQL